MVFFSSFHDEADGYYSSFVSSILSLGITYEEQSWITALESILTQGDYYVTKIRTILLWGKEDILISSVKNILTSADQLEVVVLPESATIEAIYFAVIKTHADTVIIQQGDHCDLSKWTLQLLKNHPGLRVITVNLDNNEIEVFTKKEIVVRAATDLLSVIEIGS